MKLFLRWWFFVLMSAATVCSSAQAADTVVLLHGLGRSRWSMARLEKSLEADGYRVVNLTYPSHTVPLETIAADWLPARLHETGADAAARMHFVTHSMGGILVRQWLSHRAPPANLGRVVMLAPPNHGSEVSDRLRALPPFRWFTGVNGVRLGTGPEDLPQSLGPWPAGAPPLGIIAGDRTLNPLFSAWLPGADDGKVTVASAQLAGMSDFIVLHYSHTWLAWSGTTAAQVRAFLREGGFKHAP